MNNLGPKNFAKKNLSYKYPFDSCVLACFSTGILVCMKENNIEFINSSYRIKWKKCKLWTRNYLLEHKKYFLIQCALVRSEPRCSRSIAALLNKGSFLPSSQYLCQVGLDSRPSPRPHWASHQSRDPLSCFPIGCGLQLTHPLSQALSSSYRVHRSVASARSVFSTLYRRSIRSKP